MNIAGVIAQELDIKEKQALSAIELIDEGCSIPFIARYRKEVTGSLNDEVLRALNERLAYLRSLEEKKELVLRVIEEQGKLTPELRKQIEDASTLVAVEDLYRPYRPKRRTRATIAKEKGLEGLANLIFLQDPKMSKMSIAADANFLLVKVASDQGRNEQDATMRGKYFGAAIGALKKVRTYWAKKEQWEQDKLDLLSGDVLIDRMKAEEAMGLAEEARESCGRAASTFQVFIQSHGATPDHPISAMSAGEVENLETAYAQMIPLFAKMGAEQADRVMKFGQEYLDLFPNGKARTEIINCMNQAKADLPAGDAAPAGEPVAE